MLLLLQVWENTPDAPPDTGEDFCCSSRYGRRLPEDDFGARSPSSSYTKQASPRRAFLTPSPDEVGEVTASAEGSLVGRLEDSLDRSLDGTFPRF